MALDFNVLAQTPSVVQRFYQGQQDVQQEAERNMLRQQRALQFQQSLEDREYQTQERQRKAAQETKFDQMADLIRQNGMDPDDPKVLGQFVQAAMASRNPALVTFASQMAERAAKRREEAAVQKRIQTAMGGVEGPPAPINALSPAPAVNAMQAPPLDQRELLAGTPFAIGMAPPPAAVPVAPAAPAATDNSRKIADLERRRDALLLGGTERELAAAKVLDAQINKLMPKPETKTSDERNYELAVKQGFKGTFMEYKRQMAEAERAPPQPREPREPSAPVAVVDEATGKVKYVTREEAIGKTPAKEMEGLPPKEIQRREAVFPQAKQSVATVSNTMTTIEQTIDRLLSNTSGLNGVTGLVYGRTPALTKEARAADADLEQLANLAFVQGITELRAASKSGAGVGNVSNKEGDRFENLKASLKRTQSYDDMVAALKRLKAQATSTKDTVNTEFTDMYEYRQGRAAPAAPAAGGFPAPPPAAIDALRRGQGTDAQFDAIFGPGAAARAKGR